MADFSKLKQIDIKGIIFDLDGTLYRMNWYLRPLLTLNLISTCLRLPRFLKVRSTFSGVDMNSSDNLINAISDKVAFLEKRSVQEIRSWIEDKFYPSFVNAMYFFRRSRPQINETLSAFKATGRKLAVLSDYDKVYERLKNLSIEPSLFHTLTSSERSGALKPAARPFIEIAEEWKIAPENILVIGDRNDTDGVAARAAHMHFLQISDSNNSSNTFAEWNDVRSFLNSF